MEPESLLLLSYLLREQDGIAPSSIRSRLDLESRRRRMMRIPRKSLQDPSDSAFSVLYKSASNQSLITLTGFDHNSFRFLLERFSPLYNMYTPYSTNGCIQLVRKDRGGRPRSMNAIEALGLALAWFRTRGSEMGLCIIFGLSASVCSLFIRFSHRILLKLLAQNDFSIVKMPDAQLFHEFNASITREYPLLEGVYCFMDGVKLSLESAGTTSVQNMYYNGWQHGHFVTCVFVFAPNGTIIAAGVNAPGTMHDSTIADWSGIYEKLGTCYEKFGGKCVADSAFASSGHPFLIKSAPDPSLQTSNPERYELLQQATKLRQASEWGMRAFQGSFPRLKDKLRYEERGERKVIQELATFLFNFRAHLVGQNQIATTFMPCLLRDPSALS